MKINIEHFNSGSLVLQNKLTEKLAIKISTPSTSKEFPLSISFEDRTTSSYDYEGRNNNNAGDLTLVLFGYKAIHRHLTTENGISFYRSSHIHLTEEALLEEIEHDTENWIITPETVTYG